MKEMEFLTLGFEIKSTSERKEKGVPIGIVTGYLATWDVDRGKDRFEKGAFQESLADHKNRNRMLRMKGYHSTIIGGFPIDTVYEDEKGLYVEGNINLETQLGREVYALAKQGVLTDFSIGYSVQESEFENGVRVIKKATVWEGSVVDEPMNPHANINEVKHFVVSNDNLPKKWAPLSYYWDEEKALVRVNEWAAVHKDNIIQSFLYEDSDKKLFLVTDIIDDEIKLVPRAVIATRVTVSHSKNTANIPEAAADGIKSILNDLYTEIDFDKPFTDGGKANAYCTTELKNMPRSILFEAIRFGELSKSATEQLINAVSNGETLQTPDEVKRLESIAALTELKNILKGA